MELSYLFYNICNFSHLSKAPYLLIGYTSEESFRKSVAQYIEFYNEVRPHQTLKYKTPQEVEVFYYAAV